ncbi:MAG: response regulator [Candidatus Moranbacteria bacterium]|nr:response regulator [Candidatus Moranbacteria bacterium]
MEDDTALLEALVEKFESENFDVLQAINGVEGLESALKNHPDLILLDIIMPKMDGTAMLHELKRDHWGQHVPVVMLTNISDAGRLAEALEIGIDEYLVKAEWKLKDIVERVKKILGIL